MSLSNLLDLAPMVQHQAEEYKKPRISPWDIITAINTHNTDLVTPDNEAQCKKEGFFVNRALSMGADTVILANEMNARPHLDYQLQFDFLINTIRPKKRFNKWIKAERIELLDLISEYHGYSMKKARQVLPLINQSHIDLMKTKLNKGGSQ